MKLMLFGDVAPTYSCREGFRNKETEKLFRKRAFLYEGCGFQICQS